MTGKPIYEERLSSNRTEALFLALTVLFGSLFIWRVYSYKPDFLSIAFLFLSGVFLFYSLNYRTLIIRLETECLKLKFGIFTWTVAMENIEECQLDDLPVVKRLGGAGIHFMSVHKRYRASFNFLEYPRVVISFKKKVGPIRDISFSTRRPDEVLRLIREVTSSQ